MSFWGSGPDKNLWRWNKKIVDDHNNKKRLYEGWEIRTRWVRLQSSPAGRGPKRRRPWGLFGCRSAAPNPDRGHGTRRPEQGAGDAPGRWRRGPGRASTPLCIIAVFPFLPFELIPTLALQCLLSFFWPRGGTKWSGRGVWLTEWQVALSSQLVSKVWGAIYILVSSIHRHE
jgi:hypothetical protein